MKFVETPLEGAWVIDLEQRVDDRGFFARLFCVREFVALGLKTHWVQMNDSFSQQEGTLRGMHYQLLPHCEVKVVRVIRGAIFDVILDIRVGSPTFGRWHGVELTAENRRMFYIPAGFAHGFITTADSTEVLYFHSEFYAPGSERTIRWNDPAFNIQWPSTPRTMSEKDREQTDFDPRTHLGAPAGSKARDSQDRHSI